MTHAEQIIRETVKVLRVLREEQETPLHALIWGSWGVGKTIAAKKVSQTERDVFYIKMPDGDLTRGRLYRLIGLTIGSGVRNTLEGTLDLIKSHIEYISLHPIFIIDETQRIIRRQFIISELKDLAEDIGFSYVFLGDHTLPKTIAVNNHSLFKRIAIKKELNPMTEDTVRHLLAHFGVNADSTEVYKFARERGFTTIDLAIVLQAAKTRKLELNEEVFEKLTRAFGR
ncbi:AAA family ATPase [Thermocrinis sp.]|jgi:DNA transposition AAA+ family ATPase|uniref:AAA family ATPase n=1 Tax=Thermocrinis sp. TaxID=2024383 RepID=UPI003C0B0274